MGDYSFNLEWDELPEELREEKVDDYIRHLHQAGEYTDENGEPRTIEDVLEDQEIREAEESRIASHFPIYF